LPYDFERIVLSISIAMSSKPSPALNEFAYARLLRLISESDRLRVSVRRTEGGATLVDAGIESIGGIQAGLEVSAICLADQARVSLTSGDNPTWPGAWIEISTDSPLAACMAAQYAGWSIAKGKYFAMGSGPMRAAAAKEPLIEELSLCETPPRVVGVLESRKLPPDEVIAEIAAACRVPVHEVFLVAAPTASYVGTLQVVARSVETALHKLHELKFDLRCVESAWGAAPLPPVAKDDLTAIGWTNDSILYGASIGLWVNAEDHAIESVINQVPSASSPDFGRPFLEIFERYGRDFYKIDPRLFSPARVTLYNRRTGRVFMAGRTRPDLLADSYQMTSWI
jgi:methenyltetrahydromethanopterin cyclohydrolase